MNTGSIKDKGLLRIPGRVIDRTLRRVRPTIKPLAGIIKRAGTDNGHLRSGSGLAGRLTELLPQGPAQSERAGKASFSSGGRTWRSNIVMPMKPLYAARIEDLGLSDFVKVECNACGHAELLSADML